MSKKLRMNGLSEDKLLDEAFKEFIQYSKAKNLAKRTIGYYEYNYNRFKTYLEGKGIVHINEVTQRTVQQFSLHLQSNIENGISINNILRAVRAFLYYCMKLDYLDQFKVEMVRAKKKVKKTYTDAELKLLLEKPNLKECSFPKYRNWVVINYLLATGNRVGTVVNLKIQDIDFDNGYIHLTSTKNRHEQIIPLSGSLAKILQEYLVYRKGEPEDYLFPAEDNTKIKRSGLRTAIERYNLSRGVNKTSIHLFRHTFAKKWILAGGDMFRLQKILGHSSIDVVKEYVEMFGVDLKKDYDKFNPLDKIHGKKETIRLR